MPSTSHLLRVSAPGSLMLMGEHAVLHGSHALCAAINQRMRLTLRPSNDRRFTIQSSLGNFDGELNEIEVCKPFQFVLQAIQQANLSKGFSLSIQSDFSSTIGFGSSAAVTVGVVSLLRSMQEKAFDRAAIFEESLSVIRTVQGTASGSDLAAATYGGVVNYRAEPRGIQPLRVSLPLSVVYAGYKTPTSEVISTIEKVRKLHPERFEQLFGLIDDCVKDATVAIRNGNLKKLGELVNLHHGLQSAMGCSDETLEYLIYQLRKQEGVIGAKISGSGLGDCVIGLGTSAAKVSGYDHFSIDVDPEGVRFEN